MAAVQRSYALVPKVETFETKKSEKGFVAETMRMARRCLEITDD